MLFTPFKSVFWIMIQPISDVTCVDKMSNFLEKLKIQVRKKIFQTLVLQVFVLKINVSLLHITIFIILLHLACCFLHFYDFFICFL